MELRKLLLLSPICFFSIQAAEAQAVLASAGTMFGNSGGSISFTLGEAITGTFGTGSIILSQGFQQPEEVHISGTGDPADISLFLFPNPVEGEIRILSDQPSGTHYSLFDLRGLLIIRGQLNSTETRIDLSFLEPSLYILKITNLQGAEKTIKIVKQ